MKKGTILAGILSVFALVGLVLAGDVPVGRGSWYQHPAIWPPIQVLGAAATINADACGGIKRISALAARTTDTTNSFTAPSASNAGCRMTVVNLSTNTITIDVNSNFPAAGGATGFALQENGVMDVFSNGSTWTKGAVWTSY